MLHKHVLVVAAYLGNFVMGYPLEVSNSILSPYQQYTKYSVY